MSRSTSPEPSTSTATDVENADHQIYLLFVFDIDTTKKDKVEEKVQEKMGEDSWLGSAMSGIAKFALSAVTTAKAAVQAEPDMSLGPRLGNKICDGARKKHVTLNLFELLQIHQDGKVLIAYKLKVVALDLDTIVDEKTAHRKRMPKFMKKMMVCLADRKDPKSKAADAIHKALPERVAGRLDEKGVTGDVSSHKEIEDLKALILENSIKEEKIVFADPGILYEGLGEDPQTGEPLPWKLAEMEKEKTNNDGLVVESVPVEEQVA